MEDSDKKHIKVAPKSAEIVKNYIGNYGSKTLDALINLLLCHIEIYFQNKGKESESPINTIINLHTSASLTMLIRIILNILKVSQEQGMTKAELYELRKQLCDSLQNSANQILSDEFYRFEDYIK